MSKYRSNLLEILRALRDRIASPSDVIAVTKLPRYEVLAAFHVLEALDIIRVVYSRGNYKLYQLTDTGYKLLEALETGKPFTVKIEIAENVDAEESKEVEIPSVAVTATSEGVEVAT